MKRKTRTIVPLYPFILISSCALATFPWGKARLNAAGLTHNQLTGAESQVTPEYVEGVDARGNPVAPADLKGNTTFILPDIKIYLGSVRGIYIRFPYTSIKPDNQLYLEDKDSRQRDKSFPDGFSFLEQDFSKSFQNFKQTPESQTE